VSDWHILGDAMRWYRNIATTVAVAGLAATPIACAGHSGTNAKLVAPKAVITAAPTTPRTARTFNFTLAEARAMAFFLPVGFVVVHTANGPVPSYDSGSTPGTTYTQYFENAAVGQSFVISVYRGGPLPLKPWMRPSVRRVQGAFATYVGSDPVTGRREFAFAPFPTTTVFVGGTHMTDDALLGIANGMVVAP
jgi:hypothetical protein